MMIMFFMMTLFLRLFFAYDPSLEEECLLLPPSAELPVATNRSSSSTARTTRQAAQRTPSSRSNAYEQGHKTDLLALLGGETGTLLLCLDCAITTFFGGSLLAMEELDYGGIARGQDREGYAFRVIHYGNVERDATFLRCQGLLLCEDPDCRREIYNHDQCLQLLHRRPATTL